jgi:hypothetical protein
MKPINYLDYLNDLEEKGIKLSSRLSVADEIEIHTWLQNGEQKDVLVVFSTDDLNEIVDIRTEKKTDDGELYCYV